MPRLARCLRVPCLVAALTLLTGQSLGQDADLVLRNGTIVTLDETIGTVEALAARGERIVAVGTSEQIAAHVGDATTVINLEGRLAIPGFIESHGHFLGLGHAKMSLDLMGVVSWETVIEIVAAAVSRAEPGEWIVGRGWHQEKWEQSPPDAVEGFPRHDGLSAVSPENPVLLTHASGHASFANRKAMEVAGISATTSDPAGGEILRDDAGQPIGVFRETAQQLVAAAQPASRGVIRQRFADARRAVDLATAECLSKGVTSFQDAGSSFAEIDLLAGLAESDELDIRLWMMIREPNEVLRENVARYRDLRRVGDDRLTVGGIKRTIDGALGSRGAWLLAPYADSPQSTGLATATIEDVTETAEIALASGLQLCVHAIGDRANREVLDLYERIFLAHPGRGDLRWRIEHAQHLHPDDVGRFGALDVIAAMQGIHCTSDAPWVLARLGPERAEQGAYVWRDLMQAGAVICNGTDAPVEDVDPIASFHATVSRRLADGTVFYGDQRMSRMEALRSYTINAAYAAFEQDIKGSLTPGKLADVVVLSRDILTVDEARIPDARVVMTILGGQVRYEAAGR